MLKSVRCVARDSALNVHCAHAPAAATIIVWSAPMRTNDAKSTAYDTDIVEPLCVSGSCTFSADASSEQQIRKKKRSGLARWRGAKRTSTDRPAARTMAT